MTTVADVHPPEAGVDGSGAAAAVVGSPAAEP